MPFIKAGRRVEDSFVRVRDDAPIPDEFPTLVSAERFLAASDEFADRGAPVGVIWPNNRNISELAPYLDRLALVALVFPTFRDGRAYSQARLLRERYGFRGEVRATGEVLRDQFLFLARAGFDAFEIKKESDAAAFAAALRRYSVVYQPAADQRASAFRRRFTEGVQHSDSTRTETVA
ncbi:MAG: DUF934 domain-containing protein [Rhodoplanes sp.]|jgi:uncharacterized protein (DUF934 family)